MRHIHAPQALGHVTLRPRRMRAKSVDAMPRTPDYFSLNELRCISFIRNGVSSSVAGRLCGMTVNEVLGVAARARTWGRM